MMSDLELYRRLGQIVAKRRGELQMTQAEVAKKLGLSRASLANLECGRQRIMVHQLFALTQALKLKSILELVPETWAQTDIMPDIKIAGGTALSPQQQSAVESLLASAFAEERLRKRAL